MKKSNSVLKLLMIVLLTLVPMSALNVSHAHLTDVAATGPALQLCIVVDGSSRMNETEWNITKESIADAISNTVPRDGTVEISLVQFGYPSTSRYAKIELTPRIITSSNYASTVDQVKAMTQGGSDASTAHGLYLAWLGLLGSPNYSNTSKQAINLATNQLPGVRNFNATSDLDASGVIDAKDDAIGAMVAAAQQGLDELDMEGIGLSDSSIEWFRNYVVWPQPGVVAPPFNKPGWIRSVANITEFANTISQKFQAVIPEFPSALMLLPLMLATLFAVAMKKRKTRVML